MSKWILAAALMVTGVAASAQVGVYGMYGGTGLSGIKCLDPQGICSGANGKVNPSGGFGGAYFDFRNLGPARLGVDLRVGRVKANKSAVDSAGGVNITTATSVLAGVRGTFHTPVTWVRPYAQVSAGWTRSNASETNHSLADNFAQYEVFGGVDLKVLPVMDLRAIELGIGNMNRFGSGTGTGSIGVKSIAVGVVFHLPSQ